MNTITLNRITASAWNGSDRVGYSYVDFPTDWPEEVVERITTELVRSVERQYSGKPIELQTDEIVWAV